MNEVAVVKLTEEQIFQIRHAIEEVCAASGSGRPGMLIAQIWTGEKPFMRARFIPYETARKVIAAYNPETEVMDEARYVLAED